MAAIDYSRMTTSEKLDLIGEIWDSIDGGDVTLTEAQEAELDHRLALLDEHPEDGYDAFAVSAELRKRCR